MEYLFQVEKMVSGVRRSVKVTAVDPHLVTWYGPESVQSPVREKQAQQVLEFADNFSKSYGTDLIIVAGDLNSTPASPVYSLFQRMTDSLVAGLGPESLTAPEHATWGQASNTYTGPGGGQHDGHTDRIDYIFYGLREAGRVKSVETVQYETIKRFTEKSDGSKISLSDHDWIEATIKLNF